MATGSSALMQPLWAPQPNIYNSGITRGGPEAGGDPNGSITANRDGYQLLTTHPEPDLLRLRDSRDTQNQSFL